MTGVLDGFATISVVIAVGVLLGHLGVLDLDAQRLLQHVAFHVGSPALLLTVMAGADVHGMVSRNLVATAIAVVVPVAIYVSVARLVWRRPLGETVIGSLASAYVNAGNLGIPIATYVLGNAALVAPTLMMQLLLLQPLALLLLDADSAGGRVTWGQALRRPFANPLTVATLLGVVLSLTGTTLPAVVDAPLRMIGGLAVPAMLLGYGVALRLGPRFGGGAPVEVALTSVLKSVVQPAVAYAAARFALGMSGPALLAVTVTSALPTAQNIFTHATRYRRAEAVARDTILVTTISCLPITILVAALLG
ncbi:MAG: AEC family transporter [Tetrasphaera sp.]|nr:AEC family transporter [Tetrasphaera sp.]